MKKPLRAEIVHTHEYRNTYFIKNDPSTQSVKNKSVIWRNDRKVAYTYSTLLSGINRHCQQRWYRWELHYSVGFFRNAQGTIVPFHFSKSGWKIPGHAFSLLGDRMWGDSEYVFKKHVKEVFGIESLRDLYPMTEHFKIVGYESMPKPFVSAFRHTEARPFVEQVFGKSLYRKDLLKATMQSKPDIIQIAREFRGLVPVDWIVQFLRDNPYSIMGDRREIELRPILLQINPKSYRSLLLRGRLDGESAMQIDNLSRVRRQGYPLRVDTTEHFRSWRQMHENLIGHVAIQRRITKPFEDEEIKLTPLAQKLDGLQGIEPAKHSSQMAEWGDLMRNCIASYRRTAIAGEGEYAAVVDQEGKVIGNFEISRGKLIQLLGRFNKPLPNELRTKTVNQLNAIGVDTTGNWWGKEDL